MAATRFSGRRLRTIKERAANTLSRDGQRKQRRQADQFEDGFVDLIERTPTTRVPMVVVGDDRKPTTRYRPSSLRLMELFDPLGTPAS